MNYTLTAEKAKNQAKLLAAYLATIRRKVPHGNALEAVAAMYGAKSWNVLSSNLEGVVATEINSEVAGSPLRYLEDGQEVPAEVRAEMHSDDRRAETDFDAGPWFMRASDKEILALAEISWGGDYAADTVADDSRRWNSDVKAVFEYVEAANDAKSMLDDSIGFEVSVDETDALRFLRAFRYPLFVRIALDISFSSPDAGKGYSYGVEQVEDEKWVFYYTHRSSDRVYDSANQAWAALGKQLERNNMFDWEDSRLEDVKPVNMESGVVQSLQPAALAENAVTDKVLGRLDEVGGTGAVMVLKLDEPRLTQETLQRITEDFKHYVQVAVPVSLSDLINGDIETLNDYVSVAITGSSGDLSDLSFKRYTPAKEDTLIDTTDYVYIRVVAAWDPIDGLDD